jgi:hypothetical protein
MTHRPDLPLAASLLLVELEAALSQLGHLATDPLECVEPFGVAPSRRPADPSPTLRHLDCPEHRAAAAEETATAPLVK